MSSWEAVHPDFREYSVRPPHQLPNHQAKERTHRRRKINHPTTMLENTKRLTIRETQKRAKTP
jgi:hypothetical protein